MMEKFVLASNNKKKISELRAILGGLLPDCTVCSLSDIGYAGDIEENGTSFEENSVIKASVPARLGYIGIADDSGLCVDALGGAPGIYSARYSGKGDRENNVKLLSGLEGKTDRGAKFVCVMSAVFPDGRIVTARGEVRGTILTEPRGNDGFGYDPLFYLPEYGCTSAQLSPEEKNRISHRSHALHKLLEELGKE